MSNRKHYVTFTFFHEQTRKPIPEWNTAMAARMAQDVTERYNAKPFAFQFTTELTADPVPDGEGGVLQVEGKQVAKSGFYFLGGKLMTIEDVQARQDKNDHILLSNMRGNDFPIVIETTNGYTSTNPFGEGDCVVDPETGDVVERGNSPDRIAYRAKKAAEHREELAAIGIK